MPAYARGLDWVHRNTSWKVLLHSDGAIYSLIPSLIEMGVDILNPVQPSVPGMDLRRLKEEFGGRMAFWGGACDPQHTLAQATADEVAAEVRRNVSILSEGSGYVIAPVHNIQADVPADNVIAMFDAARQVQPGNVNQ
jgi:uroporphyrinogen decarboxylase